MRAITYIYKCTLLGLLLCTVLLTLSSTALCILLYMLWITKKDYDSDFCLFRLMISIIPENKTIAIAIIIMTNAF